MTSWLIGFLNLLQLTAVYYQFHKLSQCCYTNQVCQNSFELFILMKLNKSIEILFQIEYWIFKTLCCLWIFWYWGHQLPVLQCVSFLTVILTLEHIQGHQYCLIKGTILPGSVLHEFIDTHCQCLLSIDMCMCGFLDLFSVWPFGLWFKEIYFANDWCINTWLFNWYQANTTVHSPRI